MKYLTPLLLSALSTASAFAADGTYLGANVVSPPRQNWTATAGWENNIVASGAGSTATISRELWTFNQTITNNSPLVIGNLIFTGTTQGAAYNAIITGSNTITFNTNGNGASLLESNGWGASAILINANVILANDLNIKSTPQDSSGQEVNTHFSIGSLSKIINSDNATLKTITTLKSDITPSDPYNFRIVIAGGVDGNIAIRHNSGNNLNLTTNALTNYGGLYIRSGVVNSTGIGTGALGAANNHVVFEVRDNVSDYVGMITFSGTITSSAQAIASQTFDLQTDGRIGVTLAAGTNSTITLAGQISGVGGLYKLGTSTLALAAQNTYQGDTTISAGTLIVGTHSAIASTSQLIMAAATTFSANNFNQTFASLDLNGNAFITLGEAGTNAVVFGDSSSIDWGTYTLTITGTFIDGQSVRFGTDATGLTADQLAKITINGEQAYLWSNGYLATTIPEPAVAALLTGALALALAARRRR